MRKKWLSLGYFVSVVIVAWLIKDYWSANQSKNILPILISIKNHESPLRKPGTFKEDFSDTSSLSELIYHDDTAFTFKYRKSTRQKHPFAGAWFPLENVDIDFSKYDEIEIGIQTKSSRRIPINLSNQNKKETHQYIRNFIDIKNGQHLYTLKINEFHTPMEWYEANNIAQSEIPDIDLSLIEALSIESCHLLKPGIEDKITIDHLQLKKDLAIHYSLLVAGSIFFLFCGWIIILKPFKAKAEIVHVPIKSVEYKQTQKIEDRILKFLGENYTNPDLTLDDLSKEFGKGKADISKLVKGQSKMTFPKYLNYLRIEEAKRMLRSNDSKSISEIGYAVGFNSPSNFIRVFKALEGVSPKKFEQT